MSKLSTGVLGVFPHLDTADAAIRRLREASRLASEAWALIESTPYHLVLIDKTMPDEDGLVLLARLQESQYDIPAVLITGDPSAASVDQALRLGAEDYIRKPFVSKEHLVQRIRSVLDRRITELLSGLCAAPRY